MNRRLSAAIAADLARRRRRQIVDRARQLLANDPTAYRPFLQSLSDRDIGLLATEIKRLKAQAGAEAE